MATTTPTIVSSYPFNGKIAYNYSDGSRYTYDPNTNQLVQTILPRAPGALVGAPAGSKPVDSMPGGLYPTSTGGTTTDIKQADAAFQKYQADQAAAQQAAAQPVAPVAPTAAAPVAPAVPAASLSSPQVTTVGGTTYYNIIDPASGQPVYAQYDNPNAANYFSAAQIRTGQSLFGQTVTAQQNAAADQLAAQQATTAQQQAQAQAQAAAQAQAQADAENAARVAADQAARQQAEQQRQAQLAADQAAAQQVAAQQLAQQQAAAQAQAQADAENAARVAADQAARQQQAQQLADQRAAEQAAIEAEAARQYQAQLAAQQAWQDQYDRAQAEAAARQQDEAAQQQTQLQQYADYAASKGGTMVDGIAYIPNPYPAGIQGVTINGQNMININAPGYRGYATNDQIKGGLEQVRQQNVRAALNEAAMGEDPFSKVFTGLAVIAAVATGASLLAGAGEAATAATALGETEASMAAADAMQLAAQGMSQESIAATISQTYGIDAAAAGEMASTATATVAETGVTSEALASQGVDSVAIQSGTSNLPEVLANTPAPVVPEAGAVGGAVAPETVATTIPDTAIPTVDAAGNAGYFDTATGQTLDATGQVIAEAPVAPTGPGTQVAEATQAGAETGVTSDVPYRVEVSGAAGTAEAPSYVTGQLSEGTQLATQAEIDAGTASYDAATNAWTVPVTTMPEVVVTAPAIPAGVTAGQVAAGLGAAAVGAGALGGGGAAAAPTVAPVAPTTTTPTTTAPGNTPATSGQPAIPGTATQAPVYDATATPAPAAPVTPPPAVEPQYPTTVPTEPVNPANPYAPDNIDVGGGFNPAEVPVENAVPKVVPPGTEGLPGSVASGGLSAADLAKLAAGWYILNGVLTPPATLSPYQWPKIGDIKWGTAQAPSMVGANPGLLMAPGAVAPQYHGTATQANYYWGNRPLITDASQLNTWNTNVPATNTFTGAAYAQGVGPNKLDVNQFIKNTITPQQMYAAQGTAPQYAGPVAPATSYVGGPVTP